MPRGRGARYLPTLPVCRSVPRAQPTKPPPWAPVSRASRVGGGQRDTLGCRVGLACVVRDRGVALSGSVHFSTTRSRALSRRDSSLASPSRRCYEMQPRERGRERGPRWRADDDDDEEVLSRGGCDRVATFRGGGSAPLSDDAPRQQTHARQRAPGSEEDGREITLRRRERKREGKRGSIAEANDIFVDAHYRRLPNLSSLVVVARARE